jgi:hypothetical protein
MSGAAGGTRIPRSAVEQTVKDYTEKILSKIEGFKDAYYIGIIPTSDNDISKFVANNKKNHFVGWNSIYSFCVKNKLTKVLDVFEYNDTNSGSSYVIPVSQKNMTRVNISNENNDFNGSSKVVINQDLKCKQAMEIFITPDLSETVTDLNIYINYSNGGVVTEELLISEITLPIDLSHYDAINTEDSIFTNSYYNNTNIFTYSNSISSGTTTTAIIDCGDEFFMDDDYIYVDNLYLISGTTVFDRSGVYQVSDTNGTQITIELGIDDMILQSTMRISYYKGWKFNVLRVGQTTTQLISDRYLITKELI